MKLSYIFFKKVFLIFREMELSRPNLRKLLIFQEVTCKGMKNKQKSLL